MNVNTAIGAKVKQKRTERKMTLKQLGEKTGLSVGFLSQFERGLSSIALEIDGFTRLSYAAFAIVPLIENATNIAKM